jgi:response regulator RpfG family c-di-GMP phosphodiesterase
MGRFAGMEDRIRMPRIVPVILIVEDEFLLRMDSAELIENAGFEVIQAGNADQAIEILKARPVFMSSSPISRCRVRWTG